MEVIYKDQAIDDIKYWKKSGQKMNKKGKDENLSLSRGTTWS